MTIYLMGYMGSGKSTIGSLLADKLQWGFFDTDRVIEEENDRSVQEMFDQLGEEEFRTLEKDVLLKLSKDDNSKVVSTGGGLPCNAESIEVINRNKSVHLYLSTLKIVERLWASERSTRPLLKGLNSKSELQKFIQESLEEREKYYFRSDLIVDASKPPEVVVQSILRGLNFD